MSFYFSGTSSTETVNIEQNGGILFEDIDGSNSIHLRAPDIIDNNFDLKLPSGVGNENQVLKTDGYGNLDWANTINTGYLELTNSNSSIKLGITNELTTITHDDTTGVTISASSITINSTGDLTLDSSADVILDATGNNFKFQANGTEILRITNSSSDVIIKPTVDSKDIIFQQFDGTEVARVEDGGQFNVSSTTAASSTTTGSLICGGGVGIAADLYVGDDLSLTSDAAVLNFGADSDVNLTHVHNTGLKITGPTSPQIQFTDVNYYVKKDGTTLVLHGGTYASMQCNSSTAILIASNSGGGNNTITLINGASYDNTYSLKVTGHINATLNVVANGFVATSDDRLKENEVLITDATTTLKKLKPQTYLKKESMDTTDTTNAIEESGLIAQDIYYEAPELRHLITLADDASPASSITIPSDPTQDPDYSSWGSKPSGINYSGLISYLIKSVQELSARIDVLEAN